jgi:hypothetical protein
MINKKNNFFVGVICITMMSLFTSCDKVEDSDTGGTAVEDIASDWTVEILRDGSEFASGHLSTYNTAGNTSDKLWIDDQKDGEEDLGELLMLFQMLHVSFSKIFLLRFGKRKELSKAEQDDHMSKILS